MTNQEHEQPLQNLGEAARQTSNDAEKKRRIAVALHAINPPYELAEQYLSEDENEHFMQSLSGAVHAYLTENAALKSLIPNIWHYSSTAMEYLCWIRVIEERRNEHIRQEQAAEQHNKYLKELGLAVLKLKKELAKTTKPKFVYPPKIAKYEPESWAEMKLPQKQQVDDWTEKRIMETIPEILAPVTSWHSSWFLHVLPRATYELANIPSLRWCFDAQILVTAELKLKGLRVEEYPPNGFVIDTNTDTSAEGQDLGTLYLGSADWWTPGSMVTPIALIRLLAEGELEGLGITVIDHYYPITTFAVQGYEDEVEVFDGFRRFIKDTASKKPLVQALLDMNIIDGDTAKLVEAKWEEPLPQISAAQANSVESSADNSDVLAALQSLGFKAEESKKAIEDLYLPPELILEEKVKAAIKNMGE